MSIIEDKIFELSLKFVVSSLIFKKVSEMGVFDSLFVMGLK